MNFKLPCRLGKGGGRGREGVQPPLFLKTDSATGNGPRATVCGSKSRPSHGSLVSQSPKDQSSLPSPSSPTSSASISDKRLLTTRHPTAAPRPPKKQSITTVRAKRTSKKPRAGFGNTVFLTSGRLRPDVATLVVAWPPGWSVGERVPSHQDLNFPLLVLPSRHCWPAARHTRGAGREMAGPTHVKDKPVRLLPVAVRCNCNCLSLLVRGRTLQSRSHRAKSGDWPRRIL